ncbi:hypothetical protein BJ962_001872 [Streptomyces aureorectus]|nr:hypothetical protein [Streptomyces calvus]
MAKARSGHGRAGLGQARDRRPHGSTHTLLTCDNAPFSQSIRDSLDPLHIAHD